MCLLRIITIMDVSTSTPLDRLDEDFGWTPRQRQVLDLLARRRTNAEIAGDLGITLAGAKWHVSEVMSKLGTNSRDEAAEYWRAYNRLPLRFSRAMRGLLVAPLALRNALIAIGAVAVLGLVALAVAALALNGEDEQLAPADDGGRPTPTVAATSGSTAIASRTPSVTFENADGPLFYYVGGESGAPHLLAADLASGSIVVRRPLERFATVLMSGRGQLVLWENEAPTEVVNIHPDGSRGQPLFSSSVGIITGAFSPDGSLLALSLDGQGVAVIDADTGRHVTGWNLSELPENAEGYPTQLRWIEASNQLILDLGVPRDGCGPGHIIFELDRSSTFVQEDGCNLTSPDGQLMADPGSYGCLLVGDDVLRIIRSADGEELARYEEPGAVLTPWEWSPDSGALVVRRLRGPDGYDPGDDCFFREDEDFRATEDWLLLRTSGAVEKIQDLGALFARWYPSRRIQLDCGGDVIQAMRARDSYLRAQCPDGFSTGTVIVDGQAVGEAANFVALGFVER